MARDRGVSVRTVVHREDPECEGGHRHDVTITRLSSQLSTPPNPLSKPRQANATLLRLVATILQASVVLERLEVGSLITCVLHTTAATDEATRATDAARVQKMSLR